MDPTKTSPTPSFRSRGISLLCLVVLTGLLCSCANYKLGAPGKLPFNSLHVETVENRSYAPQAQAVVTENVIEAFLRDGSVKIAGKGAAEATLSITLVEYSRERAATLSTDTTRGRSYNIELKALATLSDNRNGKVYFADREVIARELVYSDSGLTQAEYQNMPILARDLGHKIKNIVVSVW